MIFFVLDLGLLGKIDLVQRTLSNWPLIAVDKSGLKSNCLYRLREGGQMLCRSRTTDVDTVVALVSGYEYPDFALRLEPRATVVDGGANIGAFIARLMQLNVEHAETFSIHAFEAHPGNYRQLLENLELNDWSHVVPQNAAITGRSGSVRLQESTRADSVRAVPGEGDLEVAGVALSDYWREGEIIDLLKLDIEGGEYAVFNNDYEILKSRVRRVVLEYHGNWNEPRVQGLLKRIRPDFEVDVIWIRPVHGVLVLRNRA
mgnify:CR=1 FL=1